MPMNDLKIAYEIVEGYDDVVRIPLGNIDDASFVFDVLKDTFDNCLQKGYRKFVVDLENVEYPNTSLIALLLEVTSRARRLDGDVKINNLASSAKNNLETFSPGNYLSLIEDETSALNDFHADLQNDTEQSTIPIENDNKIEMPTEESEQVFSSVDIVEDPIIEKLQDQYVEGQPEAEPQITTPPAEIQNRKGERNHLKVESSNNNLYTICDFVTNYASRAGFDSKEVGKIKIAIYEACLNIIEHAYHSSPENWIDVWIEYNEEIFKIILQDYGTGFEGFSEKQYDVMSAMDGRQTGGFGLYIISRSMNEIDYRPDPKRGNRLTLIKYLPQASN